MKNLKKRALLATAAAGKLAAGSFQANAGIVYENPDDIVVNNSIEFIDIDNNSLPNLMFAHGMLENGFGLTDSNGDVILAGGSSVSGLLLGTTFDFFAEGEEINNTNAQNLEFATASKRDVTTDSKNPEFEQATDGFFASGGAGFLGFNLATGNNGWLRFSVEDFTAEDTSSYSLTIHDWAYEDSGKSIKAGEVPEPAVWSLFALGAYYIARRRNKNA